MKVRFTGRIGGQEGTAEIGEDGKIVKSSVIIEKEAEGNLLGGSIFEYLDVPIQSFTDHEYLALQDICGKADESGGCTCSCLCMNRGISFILVAV